MRGLNPLLRNTDQEIISTFAVLGSNQTHPNPRFHDTTLIVSCETRKFFVFKVFSNKLQIFTLRLSKWLCFAEISTFHAEPRLLQRTKDNEMISSRFYCLNETIIKLQVEMVVDTYLYGVNQGVTSLV